MPTPADPTRRYVLDPALLTRPFGDGLLVARSVGTAISVMPEVTYLDAAACVVLGHCAHPMSVAEVVTAIASATGRAETSLAAEVGRAMDELCRLGALRDVEAAQP